MSRNYCVVTNQWVYPRATTHGGKRLDLVFIINGIPMVIGEVKTPFAMLYIKRKTKASVLSL